MIRKILKNIHKYICNKFEKESGKMKLTCSNCNIVYNANMKHCKNCGFKLECIERDPINENHEVSNIKIKDVLDFLDRNTLKRKSTVIALDKLNNAYFVETVDDLDKKEDRLLIYIGDKIYKIIKLKYLETTIGRLSKEFTPDIDLTYIDKEKRISRRHAISYKYEGGDYIENISNGNSVSINEKSIEQGEKCKLNDGDNILLGELILLKYRKGER